MQGPVASMQQVSVNSLCVYLRGPGGVRGEVIRPVTAHTACLIGDNLSLTTGASVCPPCHPDSPDNIDETSGESLPRAASLGVEWGGGGVTQRKDYLCI